MYNILNHLREVFEALDKRGFQYEVPKNMFIAELKRSTSIFNDRTLNRWMHNFKELGYIKMKNPSILERCIDFDNPYVFSTGSDYDSAFSHSVDMQVQVDKPIEDIDAEISRMKNAKVKKE